MTVCLLVYSYLSYTGPEDPVYVIDDRGLRVRADSLSKVQRSISPQMEKIKTEQRPKSANTPKLSVGE